MKSRTSKSVTLAAITGPHGVAGEVRLKLFGEDWETLKPHKTFNDGALTLEKVRSDGKRGAIARFAEARDRTSAEKLNKRRPAAWTALDKLSISSLRWQSSTAMSQPARASFTPIQPLDPT